jgi:hypothetical protein
VVPSNAFRGLLIFACALSAGAQTNGVPKPRTGLEATWEIGDVLKNISSHADRLTAFLDKIDAKAWTAKGASETYEDQLQSSKDQAKALASGAQALAANPEKLSACLEVYFRIHSLETMLASIEDVIRRYQSPANAQALTILAAQNDGNRDRLQHYIVNLASEREQDLVVMDREAQRCRGVLTQPAPCRTPVAPRTTRRK